MIVSIPENGKLYQTNDGELSGSIYASYNLDLTSNPGRIRVSPQTILAGSATYDLGGSMYHIPVIIKSSAAGQSRWWIMGDKKLYYTTADPISGALTDDITANAPSEILDYKYSDMIEFKPNAETTSLIVSGGTDTVISGFTDISKLTAGTWTSNWFTGLGGTGLITQVPHPLNFGFNNLLLIGNKNKVHTVDIYNTIDNNRLNFKPEFEVVWIISSSTGYWIGCRNTQDREAEVFYWDGYSENFNGNYKVGSSQVYCGIIKDGVCYIMNGRGQLMAFNGAGFSEVARLPIITGDGRNWKDGNNLSIHKNGICLIDNNIHILINAQMDISGTADNYSYLENMLSGIWEYTKEHGLVHKYSITKDTDVTKTTIKDYGSPMINFGGALVSIPREYGLFYAGTYLYRQDKSQATAGPIGNIVKLNITDDIAKVGYFITPKIPTSSVQENWQRIYAVIKKLINSTDKIHIKYRTEDKIYGTAGQTALNKYGMAAQWIDGTTIIYSGPSDALVEVGEEVEFIGGVGSGLSANIYSIDGTTTIHLDETFAGTASGYGTIRINNWKKLGTDINIQNLENFEIPIDKQSSWIQFKVVMFFKGKNEIEKLLVKSEPQLSVV